MIEYDGDKIITVTSVDPKTPAVLFTGTLTLTKANPRFHAILLSPEKLLIEIYSSGEDSAFYIADRFEDGASKKVRLTKQTLKGNQGTFMTQARLAGAENKVWGILATENPSTSFYVGYVTDLGKPDFDTYLTVKTERVPDTFFQIVDGSDLYIIYGYKNDSKLFFRRINQSVLNSKVVLTEFVYKPVNAISFKDEVKSLVQGISCTLKSAGVFNCFVNVAGSQDQVVDYKFNKDARPDQDFITELTSVRNINSMKGFDLEDMRRDGEFLAVTFKRKVPSTVTKIEEVKNIADCNWLVGIYFRGNASDPSSFLTCQDWKSNDVNDRPNYAVEATTVSKVYLRIPDAVRGEAAESAYFNIYEFAPATLTPLKFVAGRILQNSGTTAPAEPMGDFTKVNIGVVGVDPSKTATPLTLDKISSPPTPPSGGNFWLWFFIILIILAIVGAVVYFLVIKKKDETSYVKSADKDTRGQSDSMISDTGL